MENSNNKVDYIQKHRSYKAGMETLMHQYCDSQPASGWADIQDNLYRAIYQLSDSERIAFAQALTVSATV